MSNFLVQAASLQGAYFRGAVIECSINPQWPTQEAPASATVFNRTDHVPS